jgi:hypothetical protein
MEKYSNYHSNLERLSFLFSCVTFLCVSFYIATKAIVLVKCIILYSNKCYVYLKA